MYLEGGGVSLLHLIFPKKSLVKKDMVLNMSESIAVTQNFANEHNFINVCDDF